MARKSKGRGTAAAFGLLLLVVGLVGGGVLYMLSVRRPSDVVDDFARAPVGCTTTLRFTETGMFYVFEDVSSVVEVPEGGCQPSADPTRTFAFELTGPDGPVVPQAAGDLSYDTDGHVGNSVAQVEISRIAEYEIVVVGDDAAVVAAIGRDPDDGVDELRRRGIIVALVGVGLGGLLLLLAGRRSKRAASFMTPDGPGWGPEQAPRARVLPLDEAHAGRQPVNPHQPDQEVAIAGPLSEVNDLLAQPPPAPLPKRQPAWAPPPASGPVPDQSEAGPAVESTAQKTPGEASPAIESPADEPTTDEPRTDESPADQATADKSPADGSPRDEARAETAGDMTGGEGVFGVVNEDPDAPEVAELEDASGDMDQGVLGGVDDVSDDVIDDADDPPRSSD